MQLVKARFRPFADEFRRDVKIVEWTPFDQRLRPKGAEKTLQAKKKVGGQIDGGKESHGRMPVLMF